jgi:hypothetical protein
MMKTAMKTVEPAERQAKRGLDRLWIDADATRRAARAAAPAGAAYRDQYRIASGRAQSAVAQERLPARLRTYVKRYFVAIHP